MNLGGGQTYVTQLLFFKNMTVVGGLLALAPLGAGGWALDSRRESFQARLTRAAEAKAGTHFTQKGLT
jgi:hypothetical protein